MLRREDDGSAMLDLFYVPVRGLPLPRHCCIDIPETSFTFVTDVASND